MKLNTAPVTVSTTPTDLISGASLSGLTGAAAAAPRVIVKSAIVVLSDPTQGCAVAIYKGASGGDVATTAVFQAGSINGAAIAQLDVELAAGEYLTAVATPLAGPVDAVITVSADITF